MKKAMMTIVLLLAITILLTACAKTPNTPAESLATNEAMSQSTPSSTTSNNNENENPAPPLTAEQKLLLSLKQDISSAMAENTKDYKVLFCGKTGNPTLADGEKAIWVQELFKAYPNSTDKAEASIKAVYVYYPMHDDPSQFNAEQLKSKGAIRVFAYLGIPDGATAQNKTKGMVCTHGGGGKAYAKYCLEAVRHGYAAIAFDTEGKYAKSGIEATTADPLGHKSKDYFKTAKKDITEQWLYYVISDCAFMNTVLRSLDCVDENKVGITGISWGGMSVTVSSCYDSRFAFCVPVYLSYFTSSQTNTGKFGDSTYNPGFDKFAAELWHDAATLEGSRVPTLIINSQKDTFADISSTSMTYNTLKKNNPHAYMLIKPNLVHGQKQGASPAEIYRFADWVCSGYSNEKSFYTIDKQITHTLGNSYEIKVTVPSNIKNVKATLYYTTKALSYNSNYALEQTFSSSSLTQKGSVTSDANGNSVYTFTVNVSSSAYLYYISFKGDSAYDASLPTTYDDAFKGKIYGSTDIVVVNGGSINK
jgi:dienelactone hydrolase